MKRNHEADFVAGGCVDAICGVGKAIVDSDRNMRRNEKETVKIGIDIAGLVLKLVISVFGWLVLIIAVAVVAFFLNV